MVLDDGAVLFGTPSAIQLYNSLSATADKVLRPVVSEHAGNSSWPEMIRQYHQSSGALTTHVHRRLLVTFFDGDCLGWRVIADDVLSRATLDQQQDNVLRSQIDVLRSSMLRQPGCQPIPADDCATTDASVVDRFRTWIEKWWGVTFQQVAFYETRDVFGAMVAMLDQGHDGVPYQRKTRESRWSVECARFAEWLPSNAQNPGESAVACVRRFVTDYNRRWVHKAGKKIAKEDVEKLTKAILRRDGDKVTICTPLTKRR
jgi:hypothetical protein